MSDQSIFAIVLTGLVLATVSYWSIRIMNTLKNFAAALLASVAAQTTTVASFVAFAKGQAETIGDLHSQLRTALEQGDTDAALEVMGQLETAQQAITDNTSALALAMAANTDSAAEVHADLPGGAGSSDTVVDPATVTLEEPTDPPVAAVETGSSGSGGDDAGSAGSGTSGSDGQQGSGAQSGSEGSGGAGSAGSGDDAGGGAVSGGTQTGAEEGAGGSGGGELSGGPGREGTAEDNQGAGQGQQGSDQSDQSGAGQGS